jgi:hypothetical protein
MKWMIPPPQLFDEDLRLSSDGSADVLDHALLQHADRERSCKFAPKR